MIEHLTAKLGLDKAGFEAGMKGVHGAVGKLNRVLGALGIGIGVAGAAGLFNKARALADNVLTLSQALGVTSDFLQGFRFAAEQSGVAVDKADKALELFTVRIRQADQGLKAPQRGFKLLGISVRDSNGVLKPAEALVFEVAQRMHDLESPTLRAAAAYDLFGGSGIQMVAVLAKGTEALKAQMEAAIKLEKAELAALDRADKAIKRWGDRTTVAVGKVTEWITFAARAWRDSLKSLLVWGGRDGGVVRRIMEADRAEEKAAEDRDRRIEEARRVQDELEAEIKKVAEEKAKADEAHKKSLKEQKELTEDLTRATAEQGNALARLDRAHKDRTSMTLADVANAQVFNREALRQRSAAQGVIALEDQARAARLHGRTDLAESALSRADALRATIGALSESDRRPLGDVVAAVTASDEKLAALLDMARTSGLKIQPTMGK